VLGKRKERYARSCGHNKKNLKRISRPRRRGGRVLREVKDWLAGLEKRIISWRVEKTVQATE